MADEAKLNAEIELMVHRPISVYEMPDESAEALLQRIDNGTAVLAFRVCAACAPPDVLERIEEGTLDLSDGDALDAQWPCAKVEHTEIARLLAEHQKAAWGMGAGTPDICRCGVRTMYEPGEEDVSIRRDRAFAAHQAEVLDQLSRPGAEADRG